MSANRGNSKGSMSAGNERTYAASEYTAIVQWRDKNRYIRSLSFSMTDDYTELQFECEAARGQWIATVRSGNAVVDGVALRTGDHASLNKVSEVSVNNSRFKIVSLLKMKKVNRCYKTIILEAIRAARNQMLSLSEIYKYFENNYGYSKHDEATWKNSVRHSLSINKVFKRVPINTTDDSLKRRALWTIGNGEVC